MPKDPTNQNKPEENVIFFGEEVSKVQSEETVFTPDDAIQMILPSQRYPLVALREGVVFSHTESILTFARPKSVAAIEEAIHSRRQVVLVTQRRDNVSDPEEGDLYTVGVLASIERVLKGDREINALVSAVSRVKISRIFHDK